MLAWRLPGSVSRLAVVVPYCDIAAGFCFSGGGGNESAPPFCPPWNIISDAPIPCTLVVLAGSLVLVKKAISNFQNASIAPQARIAPC